MNAKAKSTLKVMANIMKVENYSQRTIDIYIHYAQKFLLNFNKDPYHINQNEIVEYIMNFNYSSISQQNQIMSAVKLLCNKILNKKLRDVKIKRPRKENKSPRGIKVSNNYRKIYIGKQLFAICGIKEDKLPF